MTLNYDYVAVLVLVLLVQIPVFWMLAGRVYGRLGYLSSAETFAKMSFLRLAGLLALTQAIVHPFVFFGFMASGLNYLIAVFSGELFSVFTQAALIAWAGRLAYKPTALITLLTALLVWQLTPIISFWLYF